MKQKNIDRINELAKKKKTEGLSEEEHAEHKSLREEYLLAIRKNLTVTLDNTYIQLPNGERVKLQKKDK